MRNNTNKKLVALALTLGSFGMFSFTTTSNENSTKADLNLAEAGGPTVTCPEGDLFTCYWIQGGTVWKGSGKTTVVYN